MTDRLRCAIVGALVIIASLGATTTVYADAAGPTDYRSEVVSVDPETPTIEVAIVGGDSFVELTADEGTEVFVLGYEGEQYLWFRPDGSVFENQNSPATYINGSRYGAIEIPSTVDVDADADWKQVGSGGHWAWHDHRTHWMQTSRPAGRHPGDQILDATIPLVVDGVDVEVDVISTWLPAPSSIPAAFGAIVGAALAALSWRLRRRGVPSVTATAPAALAALVVGAWQYLSLPAVTGPRPIWFVLPLIAVVSAAFGIVTGRRGRTFAADAAQLLVGVELAIWGFLRRDGLSAAIIPTGAPHWLDRFTTAMALVGGVSFAGLALWWLFVATGISGSREPTGSPHPAHP